MDYEHLRYEQDGPVTVITIDRPERMNAVGPTTARELIDAWTRFRDDHAECFDRLIDGPEMAEGLRRFNQRDHPDRVRDGAPATPGLARPLSDGGR